MVDQDTAHAHQQHKRDASRIEDMIARIGLLLTGIMLVSVGHSGLAILTLIGILPTTRVVDRIQRN